jgi:UDPglucose 6-dehydrogenase
VNGDQKGVLIRKITARLGDDLRGRSFAVWGLAFKPNTDDMREAPSRQLIAELLARGARIRAYDPVAMDAARRVFASDLTDQPDHLARLEFFERQEDAAVGADALIVVTEWKEFKSPNFAELRLLLSTPIIFDGRNLYDPEAVSGAGIEYYGIGRPTIFPAGSEKEATKVESTLSADRELEVGLALRY